MVLYLIAALPLFFALVAFLPWNQAREPRTLALMATFLKGALVFLPAYLAILLVRGIFGFSYEGLLLYLSLLQHDHLVPVLAGLGGFLLLQRKLSISRDEETIFLTVFSYLSGFFAMLNLTDAFSASGSWDAYAFFLLPSLRLATVLLVSLLARRFFRWEGTDGALFCGAGAGLAILLSFSSFFFRINRAGLSILCAVVPLLMAVSVFAMRFPRALRD
ncbi:MAG: hypothetical protein ABSB63_17835 [Spirochaetia bacterium]|jgi:hypothetical protein